MVWVYFDASALVKRYSLEEGTPLVNEIFRQLPPGQMTCAMIGILEVISVLVRKQNDGRLPSHLFTQAMLEFNREIIENEDLPIAPINDELLLSALELIARHNLNATDAVILRSCLNLQQALTNQGHRLILWSSDKRLLRAAQQEGLIVFDPEVETLTRLQIVLSSD